MLNTKIAPSTVELIVACDSNNGISKNGAIPWRIAEDMKYFRECTTGDGSNAIIYGRNTYESFPRGPLPNRINIMVSNTTTIVDNSNSLIVARSLQDAITIANAEGCKSIFICGGSRLYNEAINHGCCGTLHITRIPANFDCDNLIMLSTDGYDLTSCRRIEIPKKPSGVDHITIEVWKRR